MKKRIARSRRDSQPASTPQPAQQKSTPRWLLGLVGIVAASMLIYCVVVLVISSNQSALQQSKDKEPSGVPAVGISETLARGEQAFAQGHVVAAERFYKQTLGIDPANIDAINRLAYILGVEGRCWEANQYLIEAVRHGQFSLHHLVLLGALEPVIDDPPLLQRCRTDDPRDLLVLVGAARTAMKENETQVAHSLLKEAVAANPQSLEAHAWLGRQSVHNADDPTEVARWEASLPADADLHPEIWVTRGQWTRAHGQSKAAIRCFLQAIALDPNHRIAHLEAGQLFAQSNQSELAQAFLDRAERLRRLGFLVDEIFKQPSDWQRMQQASTLTEELGRHWEAWAWSRLVLSHQPNSSQAVQRVQKLQRLLEKDLPQTLPGSSPASQIQLADYPLPEFSVADARQPKQGVPESGSVAQVGYNEMADALGIDFTYHRGSDPETGEMRMLETTGGGVGILDFDADGWPDVYFTQSSDWPPGEDSAKRIDRLFRNLGGKRFVEVAIVAGVGDDSYSQGVTVGDYNNDGFDDLYVANFGRNRLYRNNGDGTFSDVSEATGIGGEHWTTSCLLADLNGDGCPDIYDVNYLSGDDAARSICRQGDELRWCSPSEFAGDQDQIYLNDRQGRFLNETASVGITRPDGKGLGIVAADFDTSGWLSLFVANDAVANFFFTRAADLQTGQFKLNEHAVLNGLAFDGDGLPQACMGVAVDDANGDGRLDLFVTNFYEQANTLYLQQPGLQFIDATREAGLFDASFQLLGFGTQFLDGDLDGHPDLVVANGHVLDLSARGIPYAMRPQYFQNNGSGRFHEKNDSTLGDYFRQHHLGRGMARLDWNRDGKEDFVVSNIGTASSFLSNASTQTGHSLTVVLHGVHCSRDAIGTKVTLEYSGTTRARQLIAGDGYQASNQRQLIFGTGEHQTIDVLTVRWPSGEEQRFEGIPADGEVQIVEGFNRLLRFPIR